MANRKAKSLAAIPGALVLVGAGKMGGAMLDGWLARKLPPKKVIVLEPQPSKAIKALGKRGVRINPERRCRPGRRPGDRGEAAERARRTAAARSADRSKDRRGLDHGRANARLSRTAPAERRHRARHAEHAGGHRPRHHRRGRQPPRRSIVAQARAWPPRRDRLGRVGERRGADGRGDRGVGLRPGLCLPAGRSDGGGRRCGGAAGCACRKARARDGRRLRRTHASLAAARRDLAPERHLARRHHRRGAGGADGQRRRRAADDQSRRRRDQAWQRFGGVNFAPWNGPVRGLGSAGQFNRA